MHIPTSAERFPMDLHEAAANGVLDEVERLLQAGVPVDALDADSNTALQFATAGAHRDIVQRLLTAGADPNGRPLTAACDSDTDEPRVLDIVRLLVDAGADVNCVDDGEQTPLMKAAFREWPELAQFLLAAGAEVDAADEEGTTALLHALSVDSDRPVVIRIARLLLEAGADLEHADDTGQTPLMLAAANGYVELVRELLDFGAEAETVDEDGRSAMTRAAESLANLTDDDRDTGLDPDEIRAGLVELGIDLESERGRQMLDQLQNPAVPNEFTLSMSGAYSAAEFEDARATGIRWLNEILDLLAKRGCALERAVPYLVRAGREDLLPTEGLCWDATEGLGHTALTAAVRGGKFDRVRWLLQAGANPNAKNYFDDTPLKCAPATRRGLECARLLVAAGADLNARDGHELTVLERAIEANWFEMIKLLLEAGADPNVGAPVLWAARNPDPAALRLLLAHGANPNSPLDVDGQHAFEGFLQGTTPLMRAAADKPIEILELLLGAGAEVNAVDRTGRSAVDLAMHHGRLDVARWLQEHGTAGPGAASFDAALWAATKSGDARQVRECLARRANPRVRDERGLTPLILAAREGHLPIVELLLGAGADVNACSEPGDGGQQTPLRCAVVRGHAEIVRKLVDANADVRATFDYSSIPASKPNSVITSLGTPLHDAARSGREDLVETLLQGGADANAVDSQDHTPLVVAASYRNWNITAQLLAAGATRREQDATALAVLDFPSAAALPEFGESVRCMEQLCGSQAQPCASIPGLQILTVLPDGDPPPKGQATEDWQAYFGFSRSLDEKLWRVLDAGYENCLARGHLVLNPGMPRCSDANERYIHLLPTADKYAVLWLYGVRANEMELTTREIIAWLRDFERDHPFRLRGCSFDVVDLEFTSPLADPESTARRLDTFCPDLTAQNYPSMAALVRHLATQRRVHLWWD